MARIIDYIQLGPSCDLDEHGDPKPPKYVPVTGWRGHPDDEQPSVLARILGRLRGKRRSPKR